MNGATCTDEVNDYSCECATGYTGEDCETNIDDCVGEPCLNGATCVDGVDSFSCDCAAGYEGPNCGTGTVTCWSLSYISYTNTGV